jgi:hypothetical protein
VIKRNIKHSVQINTTLLVSNLTVRIPAAKLKAVKLDLINMTFVFMVLDVSDSDRARGNDYTVRTKYVKLQ